jgi:hypothetical protein
MAEIEKDCLYHSKDCWENKRSRGRKLPAATFRAAGDALQNLRWQCQLSSCIRVLAVEIAHLFDKKLVLGLFTP